MTRPLPTRCLVSKLLRTLLLPAILIAAGAFPAAAQILSGRVADGVSKRPLTDVTVSLLDPDANVLDSMAVDADGRFEFSVPGPGDYYVRAERISYTTVTDGILEFQSQNGVMEIVLFMNPRPLVVEGIDVQIQREQVRRRLRSQGFYQRAASGFGRFIGPRELEERILFSFGDILRGIPGVTYSGETIQFRGGAGSSGICTPNVYIDGARAFDTVVLYTLIPEDVEAVEVYRGAAQTPMQWSGINGTCGAIVVWTKTDR